MHCTAQLSWLRLGGNLEGAPESIKKSFVCIKCNLDSLKGAPKWVGGNFYCFENNLTSLEGAPEKVGGSFNCRLNPLKSIRGVPKAEHYILPDGFTEADARKEVERRKFRKDLDKKTVDTWGDFIEQL